MKDVNSMFCRRYISLAALILALSLMFGVTACAPTTAETSTPPVTPSGDAEPGPGDVSPSPSAFAPPDGALLENVPQALRDILDENRQAFYAEPVDGLIETVESYRTPDLDPEKDAQLAAELRRLREESGVEAPEILTHEEAKTEIDYLFDLIKYGYGAYQYFGGEPVFDALKTLILQKLSQKPDPVDVKVYIEEVLAPCLRSVITDNHFWIGGQSVGSQQVLYYNEDVGIDKVGEDFTLTQDGKVYRILSIGSLDPGQLIRPTINRDGELAWALSAMAAPGRASVGVMLTLENTETGETSTQRFVLPAASISYVRDINRDTVTLSEVDGMPILENRRLYEREEGGQEMSEFLATAALVRNKPALILDLRGNEGGNSNIAQSWVYSYTFQYPRYNFCSTVLTSETAREINSGGGIYPTLWAPVTYDAPVKISNKRLVMVLIDPDNGSSGENFIGFLRQVENVVFVGAPSAGCLLCGNVGSTTLPTSRQKLQFGVNLNILPDLSQFEGVGFAPDLWVPPGESVERVVKFLARYGLKG